MPFEGACTSKTGTNVSYQVVTGSGKFYGMVLCVSTSAGSATLYDGTTTSGPVLSKLILSNTATVCQIDNPPIPVPYNSGLYLSVSGSGMTTIVRYV